GTADVIIADRSFIKRGIASKGIRLCIELKKGEIKSQHNNQMIFDLLCTNLVSNFAVVSLLTNLGNIWRFYWLVSSSKVQICTFDDIKKGVAFLEELVREFDFPKPATRDARKLLEAITGDVQQSGGLESSIGESTSGGLKSVLRIPKVDVM